MPPGCPTDPDPPTVAAASLEDLDACYRLLLGRGPDPEGLAHYRPRLAEKALTVRGLVSEFLGSVEFARSWDLAHARRSARELVSTVEGFRIYVDPSDFAVGHTVTRTGSYEPDVSAVVRRFLAPGATFVDVGANIGWFSLLAAGSVGPSGRVVAVEPNPANVSLLRSSAKENGFDNITVACVAVADQPGAVALETDGSNGRVIPITGPPAQPVEASYVVAARPLDAVLADAGAGPVDVIKVDVEGAEPLVLNGASEMLGHHRPVLVTEFYPLALDSSPWGSAAGYLAQLRLLGYGLHVIGDDGEKDDSSILSMAAAPGRDHVDLLCLPGPGY